MRTTNPAKTGPFEATGPIITSGAGLVYIELRPDLDFETIRGNAGIPTRVSQGIFKGFSLPIWDAGANINEELYGAICVPDRYDEASDILVHLYCWIAQAEDNKNFNMQLSWEHYTPGTDVVPITTNDVAVETPTGVGAVIAQSYKVPFTIDYDIHTPNNIVADDIIQVRFRRIAASANECAGEIVVNHYGLIFRRNKLGVAAP